MSKTWKLLLIAFASLLISCKDSTPIVSSSLITNAMIYDGSGNEAFRAAVRIDGDRIVEIGDIVPLDNEVVFDAGGLALAPGFIDTHNHHDSSMDSHLQMPGVLSQGITTIVRGADGYSDAEDLFGFTALAEFNSAFERTPPAINIASFSPHNSIRREVMGDDYKRVATDAELNAMGELLDADMASGAIGLSTGLEYEPGMYASTDELIHLSKIAAASGGRYISHIRDEDEKFVEAVDEVIRIGKEADLPVQISHIKIADKAYFGTADKILQKLDTTRANGIDISADIYPYQHWASDLSILFPDRDFSNREHAAFAFAHTAGPEDIFLFRFSPNPEFAGLSIAEIANATGGEPETVLTELAQAGARYKDETKTEGTWIVVKGMDESDVVSFMQWEFTNICSDGLHGGGHPRDHGSFPRVLRRYVRELGALSMARAIHKMTAKSAASMGIENRGRILPGYFADLVLFDPGAIEDKATMENPDAMSVGVDKVWVNGVGAFDDGEPTMRFPGRIVARGNQ
jgi:N-acyl-D-amino-acid deacylase